MSDQSRRRVGAPPARAASPAVAVVAALIAAILGFLILKQFDDPDKVTTVPAGQDNGDSGDGGTGDGTETTVAGAQTPVPTPAPTLAPSRTSYTVIVANAARQKGVAAGLTSAMEQQGFSMIKPAINALGEETAAITIVYYRPNFQAAAEDVVRTLQTIGPGISAQPMPAVEPVPPEAATAQVVIVLATDIAGKTLGNVQVGTGVTQPPLPSDTTAPTTPTS